MKSKPNLLFCCYSGKARSIEHAGTADAAPTTSSSSTSSTMNTQDKKKSPENSSGGDEEEVKQSLIESAQHCEVLIEEPSQMASTICSVSNGDTAGIARVIGGGAGGNDCNSRRASTATTLPATAITTTSGDVEGGAISGLGGVGRAGKQNRSMSICNGQPTAAAAVAAAASFIKPIKKEKQRSNSNAFLVDLKRLRRFDRLRSRTNSIDGGETTSTMKMTLLAASGDAGCGGGGSGGIIFSKTCEEDFMRCVEQNDVIGLRRLLQQHQRNGSTTRLELCLNVKRKRQLFQFKYPVLHLSDTTTTYVEAASQAAALQKLLQRQVPFVNFNQEGNALLWAVDCLRWDIVQLMATEFGYDLNRPLLCRRTNSSSHNTCHTNSHHYLISSHSSSSSVGATSGGGGGAATFSPTSNQNQRSSSAATNSASAHSVNHHHHHYHHQDYNSGHSFYTSAFTSSLSSALTSVVSASNSSSSSSSSASSGIVSSSSSSNAVATPYLRFWTRGKCTYQSVLDYFLASIYEIMGTMMRQTNSAQSRALASALAIGCQIVSNTACCEEMAANGDGGADTNIAASEANCSPFTKKGLKNSYACRHHFANSHHHHHPHNSNNNHVNGGGSQDSIERELSLANFAGYFRNFDALLQCGVDVHRIDSVIIFNLLATSFDQFVYKQLSSKGFVSDLHGIPAVSGIHGCHGEMANRPREVEPCKCGCQCCCDGKKKIDQNKILSSWTYDNSYLELKLIIKLIKNGFTQFEFTDFLSSNHNWFGIILCLLAQPCLTMHRKSTDKLATSMSASAFLKNEATPIPLIIQNCALLLMNIFALRGFYSEINGNGELMNVNEANDENAFDNLYLRKLYVAEYPRRRLEFHKQLYRLRRRYLQATMDRPMKLKFLTRLVIRQTLGGINFQKRINSINLPDELTQFLIYIDRSHIKTSDFPNCFVDLALGINHYAKEQQDSIPI